ncbi:MAG: hypothetical protein ACREBR_01855, partial [bacterium]
AELYFAILDPVVDLHAALHSLMDKTEHNHCSSINHQEVRPVTQDVNQALAQPRPFKQKATLFRL